MRGLIEAVGDIFRLIFGSKSSDQPVRIPLDMNVGKAAPVLQPPTAPPPTVPKILRYNFQQVRALPVLTREEYVQAVMGIALQIEKETGIFHMVPIAQSAHESRNGNSKLARFGMNLFGIKATKSWYDAGMPDIEIPSIEDAKMEKPPVRIKWRLYPSWYDSFQDWAGVIFRVHPVAFEHFKNRRVREGYLALRASGYAEDEKYATKLIANYEDITKGRIA